MSEKEMGILQDIKKDLDVIVSYIKAIEERRSSKIADDHKFFSKSKE